ncbi:formate dehydrogenase accessory sulfurtransferase FdhD [Limoniibacter endophyticus]|uniref:Sulfur carrier protein FdhD n=1 Tax=Limoniibacter endophyticus TaxID=1565040 RepID=A0A8J3DIU1_9HYPH|nr:formate dehydrogenase accessory sulfurtransferase FdhD [Limoniibacter endophyticus]GHC72466.1 sulfurtransferase FdhD [Limoniibacter endophyticus]
MMDVQTARAARTVRWRNCFSPDERTVLEEQPVALTINGSTYAVMLATPVDLEDFAVGLAFSEGLIDSSADILSFEAIALEMGLEARLWLEDTKANAVSQSRRAMAGPSGCGLCGVESLELTTRRLPYVNCKNFQVKADDLVDAMDTLEMHQPINLATRSAHAAALWKPGSGLITVREDVGRHNALDKLIGSCLRGGVSSEDSVLLITSRISLELVQKAAAFGAPLICAVSAPTTLALKAANTAGITLIGIARHDGFEIFTHAERVVG